MRLIAFNTGHYQAIDLSLWLAANPDYLLEANFGQKQSVIDKLPRRRGFIAARIGLRSPVVVAEKGS